MQVFTRTSVLYLCGANLERAKLIVAKLIVANLSAAYLIDADLIDADLDGANLDGANLKDADLSSAKSLTPEQVQKAKNWEKAKYVEEFRAQLGLPPEPAK